MGINLPAIYIANILGLLVMLIIIWTNWMKLHDGQKENRILYFFIFTIVLSCIVDPLVFYFDGKPSALAPVIVYAGNFWLFFSNMIIGPVWIRLVSLHLTGKVERFHRIFIVVFSVIGVCLLLVNFSNSIVFGVDENHMYFRGPAFWIFTLLEVIYIADGVVVYIRAKRQGGVFKFFPVLQFIIPVILGVVIQSLFYGTSTIWPCLAISACGVFSSLQNEAVYQDRLTGLYNRYYLDNVKKKIAKKKSGSITGLMMDMNDFKSINDNYGHLEGDKALVAVAEVLRSCVGALGIAVRYAGDEFVVLLNTQDEAKVNRIISSIHSGLEVINALGKNPYRLSLAIGSCPLDLKTQTVDELLNEVDKRMYEAKRAYYAATGSDRRKRRT